MGGSVWPMKRIECIHVVAYTCDIFASHTCMVSTGIEVTFETEDAPDEVTNADKQTEKNFIIAVW
jgi:hypothetical protein